MKCDKYKLNTSFDIGCEVKSEYKGLELTRNIKGFNVTMTFLSGVCKVCINNIEKLNIMTHIDEQHRNVDFKELNSSVKEDIKSFLNDNKSEKTFEDLTSIIFNDVEKRQKNIKKIEYILNIIKNDIKDKYYNKNKKVLEYNSSDLDECGKFYVSESY